MVSHSTATYEIASLNNPFNNHSWKTLIDLTDVIVKIPQNCWCLKKIYSTILYNKRN